MSTRVAINGFGRMGRLALRAGWDRDDLEFVHVNEVDGGPGDGAPTCSTFDSVHGRWARATEGAGDELAIDGERIGYGRRRRRPATSPGASSASTSCSSAPAGSARVETLEPYFDARRAEGRSSPRRSRTARAERRRRRQRRPLRPGRARRRHRGVVHDELPGAGGQGASTRASASGTARSRRSTT